MSNFHNLKSFWQSKNKVQSTNPPPISKPPPEKIVNPTPTPMTSSLPAPRAPSIVTPHQIKKQQQIPKIKSSESVTETENTKMSTADIRKMLETNLKLGLNIPRPPQIPQSSAPKFEQPKQQLRDTGNNNAVVQNQKIPTFEQSKQNLQKMFEKKKAQKEGYFTGPPSQATSQGYIDLKKQQALHENLSPEERTQLVMKRVFSTPQSTTTQPGFVLQGNEKEIQTKKSQQSLLAKQQQVKSLNLRGGKKKEKRKLDDFDDA